MGNKIITKRPIFALKKDFKSTETLWKEKWQNIQGL